MSRWYEKRKKNTAFGWEDKPVQCNPNETWFEAREVLQWTHRPSMDTVGEQIDEQGTLFDIATQPFVLTSAKNLSLTHTKNNKLYTQLWGQWKTETKKMDRMIIKEWYWLRVCPHANAWMPSTALATKVCLNRSHSCEGAVVVVVMDGRALRFVPLLPTTQTEEHFPATYSKKASHVYGALQRQIYFSNSSSMNTQRRWP